MPRTGHFAGHPVTYKPSKLASYKQEQCPDVDHPSGFERKCENVGLILYARRVESMSWRSIQKIRGVLASLLGIFGSILIPLPGVPHCLVRLHQGQLLAHRAETAA